MVDAGIHVCLFSLLDHQFSQLLHDMATECLCVLACKREMKHKMLVVACYIKAQKAVEILLQLGADANILVDGETPLTICCAQNDVPLVKILLNHGATRLEEALTVSVGKRHDTVIGIILKKIGLDRQNGLLSLSGLQLREIHAMWFNATFIGYSRLSYSLAKSVACTIKEKSSVLSPVSWRKESAEILHRGRMNVLRSQCASNQNVNILTMFDFCYVPKSLSSSETAHNNNLICIQDGNVVTDTNKDCGLHSGAQDNMDSKQEKNLLPEEVDSAVCNITEEYKDENREINAACDCENVRLISRTNIINKGNYGLSENTICRTNPGMYACEPAAMSSTTSSKCLVSADASSEKIGGAFSNCFFISNSSSNSGISIDDTKTSQTKEIPSDSIFQQTKVDGFSNDRCFFTENDFLATTSESATTEANTNRKTPVTNPWLNEQLMEWRKFTVSSADRPCSLLDPRYHFFCTLPYLQSHSTKWLRKTYSNKKKLHGLTNDETRSQLFLEEPHVATEDIQRSERIGFVDSYSQPAVVYVLDLSNNHIHDLSSFESAGITLLGYFRYVNCIKLKNYLILDSRFVMHASYL